MIFKRCPRCNARVKTGEACGCVRRDERVLTSLELQYKTARWARLRKHIISLYDGLDPYALSKGRIEKGDYVHHIIPAKDDPSLFWTVSNLIPLSRRSHDEVHAAYHKDKDSMIRLLQSFVKNESF